MAMYRCAGVEYVRWSWAFAASIFEQDRAYFRVGGDVAFLGFRLPALRGSFWRLLVRSRRWSSLCRCRDIRANFLGVSNLL